jgi:hypothetical protein
MNTFKFTVQPLTAFGTPLAGDTLFGHLCWAIRERNGENGLSDLLEGYTAGRPFLVASDGFPEGLIPRPTAPDSALGLKTDPSQRKRARRLRWLQADRVGQPVERLIEHLTESGLLKQVTTLRTAHGRSGPVAGQIQNLSNSPNDRTSVRDRNPRHRLRERPPQHRSGG